jgi:hypothetical protein
MALTGDAAGLTVLLGSVLAANTAQGPYKGEHHQPSAQHGY